MSWELIHVGDRPFLFNCAVEEGDTIQCFFSDFMHIWAENCSINEVLTRAKELNKRIEYDRSTILKTITTQPIQSEIESSSKADFLGNICELNVKYYISNRPMNFKWKFEMLPQTKFVSMITNPLLLSIRSLIKQNEDLKDIIQKKDVEIEQYKMDGATLKRYKLATEPFSLEKFERNHSHKPIEGFIKYIDVKFQQLETNYNQDFPKKQSDRMQQSDDIFAPKDKTKKSPKTRRMGKLIRKQPNSYHNRINGKDAILQYGDSDSCTPPMNDDIAEILRSTEELKRKHEEDLQLKNMPESKKTCRTLNL